MIIKPWGCMRCIGDDTGKVLVRCPAQNKASLAFALERVSCMSLHPDSFSCREHIVYRYIITNGISYYTYLPQKAKEAIGSCFQTAQFFSI